MGGRSAQTIAGSWRQLAKCRAAHPPLDAFGIAVMDDNRLQVRGQNPKSFARFGISIEFHIMIVSYAPSL